MFIFCRNCLKQTMCSTLGCYQRINYRHRYRSRSNNSYCNMNENTLVSYFHLIVFQGFCFRCCEKVEHVYFCDLCLLFHTFRSLPMIDRSINIWHMYWIAFAINKECICRYISVLNIIERKTLFHFPRSQPWLGISYFEFKIRLIKLSHSFQNQKVYVRVMERSPTHILHRC